jgi:hypothetical protein
MGGSTSSGGLNDGWDAPRENPARARAQAASRRLLAASVPSQPKTAVRLCYRTSSRRFRRAAAFSDVGPLRSLRVTGYWPSGLRCRGVHREKAFRRAPVPAPASTESPAVRPWASASQCERYAKRHTAQGPRFITGPRASACTFTSAIAQQATVVPLQATFAPPAVRQRSVDAGVLDEPVRRMHHGCHRQRGVASMKIWRCSRLMDLPIPRRLLRSGQALGPGREPVSPTGTMAVVVLQSAHRTADAHRARAARKRASGARRG